MSDHIPTSASGEDRMRDTLTALRSDTDLSGLADPASVRRRGQARTRHQAVAGLCAAVVVVAVAVTGGSLLGGQSDARHSLPATQSPSPTHVRFIDRPLLRAGDVDDVGPYKGFLVGPSPVSEDQRSLECIASPTTLGAVEGLAAPFFAEPDAHVIEHALSFADASAAAEAVNRLAAEFASCKQGKESEVTVNDRGPLRANGIGGHSETLNASRLTTPRAAGEVHYYELGVARLVNVVVVLEWTSIGKPVDDTTTWVLSSDLLSVAIHRATG
jgi:hypothetical protein